MTTPNYVRRGGLDNQPPPWTCARMPGTCDGITGRIFVMLADGSALQTLCKRYLNDPGGGVVSYSPVTDFVALTFQHFDRMRSTSTHCQQRATFTYNEASFWVPVIDARSNVGVEFLIPYMFIDNGLTMAAGRETYGYPKEMADVYFTPSVADCSVSTLAVRDFAADAAAVPTMLVRCSKNTAPFVQTDQSLAIMTQIHTWLSADHLDLVFLREFRAVGGGPGADVQEIVRATAEPFGAHDVSNIPFRYSITLTKVESHPIAADLGLAVNASARVDVEVALDCQIDAVFTEGTRIAP